MENKITRNKKIKNIMIIFAIILIGITSTLFVSNIFFKKNQSYNYKDINSYNIDVENAEISIVTEKGIENKTEIKIYMSGIGNYESILVIEKDGILSISQNSKVNLIPNIGGSVKVELINTYVDENRINNFTIHTKSGAVKAQGINSELIDIDTHSGKVHLSEIISDKLTVKTQSGEIAVDNIYTQYFENTSQSGKCTVSFNENITQLSAVSKSSSGDVSYIFTNDIDLNLSWKARNVTSEIESDENSLNKLYFESESGNIKIIRP
ncbi:DUF4097 family beta strand repeat-containing protein [Faecalicatena contorta]|uniref:Adhesin n=1 Tax=Faecalicatena contorta TaxID=39482 RepID=A0A315ZSE9_9FIRM|nr:DUF4097 family beta strand repeat-containing protein [Faecalicatena contorta]PWJ48063.1 putative adhesin [Faecalicatena contorta]SUQ15590.1 Putative adhesin [Faecalicatena contorta]